MEKKRHLTVRMELPRGASEVRIVHDDGKWNVKYSLRGRTLMKSVSGDSFTVHIRGDRPLAITRRTGDMWPTRVDGRGVFVGCNRIPNDEVLDIIRASDRVVRLPLSRRKESFLPRKRWTEDGYNYYRVFRDGGVARSTPRLNVSETARPAIARETVVRLKRMLAADPRHSKLLP